MSTTEPHPAGQRTVPASGPDHSTAIKFLDFIFGEVPGGHVEFRFLAAGKKLRDAGRPAYVDLPLNHERVITDVLNGSETRGVAFGPAPRFHVPDRGRRGKDQDVIGVGCVWAGLDYQRVEGGAVEVVRRVRNFPLRPSVAVSSGYGHQLYFVFNTMLGPEKLIEWSDLMRALRSALRTDDEFTLGQVRRLPGTLNLRHERPAPCGIWEEYSGWTRYGFDEVRESLERECAAARGTSPAFAGGYRNDPPARENISLDSLRERGADSDLLEAILTGRVRAQLGGSANAISVASGTDFWVASRLYALGLGGEEIKDVFRAHPGGCGRAWSRKRDGERYLEVTLSKVEQRAGVSGGGPTSGGGSPVNEAGWGWLPPGYKLDEVGSVWYYPPVADSDRKAAKPMKVSNSPLRITEIRENVDTGQITLSISFEYLGRGRTTHLLRAHMSDSRQLVSALAGEGAPVTSNNARHVLAYLEAYEHAFASSIPHKLVTSRFGRGRANGPFFFPGLSSSTQFSPASSGDASLYRAYSSRRGTLRAWVGAMRELADHSLVIPQVTVLAAFVPPLQRRLQIPNFILDLYGNTSTGKSTSLRLAASAYGRPHDPDSLVQQWMNTQAAVERFAGVCGELPIFLDDAQHCPAELKMAVVYMIANGRGKGRSAGRGGVLEAPTWQTVALSTSEDPLHEASPHEGVRGRILPVGGASPPFPPRTASLVQALERAVTANHGHAGEAFIRHLNGLGGAEWRRLQRRYSDIRSELLRASSSDVVGRVSGYIAAIQLAGEVAIPLLGLPFEADVIGGWLMLHLEEQQSDQNLVLAALRALADYYVANVRHFADDGQYEARKRGAIHGASRRGFYVAFLRSTIDAVFRPRKWNQAAVLGKLAEAGALYATEGERFTKKVGVSGISHRMVCVKWPLILPGGEDATSTTPTRNDVGDVA